jgi:nitrile hydratase accessory protein
MTRQSDKTKTNSFTPAPVFSAVWHAQLFALTTHLYDQGLFTWPQWTAALAYQIQTQRDDTENKEDTEHSYYLAWMDALTACIVDQDITDTEQLQLMKDRWASAYLFTPHGQPVCLPKGS